MWEKKYGRIVFFVLLLMVGIAITGVAVYSSYELYKIKSPGYAQRLAEEQTAGIISAVGRLIELPDDAPQIATVSDVNKLKEGQAFFAKAHNGDYILIFQTEAILYRPSARKIINVASVNREQPKITPPIQTPPATPPASSVVTPPFVR